MGLPVLQWPASSDGVACIHDEPHIALLGLDEEGRSKRSAAAKKPRSKQLLCEQDPEAPGLTLEQRRKIRRHAPAWLPARPIM